MNDFVFQILSGIGGILIGMVIVVLVNLILMAITGDLQDWYRDEKWLRDNRKAWRAYEKTRGPRRS